MSPRLCSSLIVAGAIGVALVPRGIGQNCTPNNPGPGPQPPQFETGQCEPGGTPTTFARPQLLSVWPTSEADVTGDPLRVGIPFYVEAIDQDKYIQKCTWGDIKETEISDNDTIEYSYTIISGNLPETGTFVAGDQSSAVWNHPAAVYRPPRGLDPGVYQFQVQCIVDDTGGTCDAADPGFSTITWDITLTVANCQGSVTIVLTQPPPPPPPGALTLKGGVCCVTVPQWWPGPAIKPVGPVLMSDIVEVGQYVVFASKHEDTDYLVRFCDDNPPHPHCPNPTGIRSDFLECSDACQYTWSSINLTGTDNGTFMSTHREYAVVWHPTAPGFYEICQSVDNWPGQALDPTKVSPPFPFYVLVTDTIAVVESKPANEPWTLLNFCDQIGLYVNGDDDDMDGVVDNQAPGAVANENDLHAIRFTNTTGLPDGSLEIRIRLQGDPNSVNLFIAPDRSAVYPKTNPPWISFFSGATIYVEGVEAHMTLNRVRLLVDVRLAGAQDSHAAMIRLDATVFGVARIRHESDPAPNGRAVLSHWDSLHALERPEGFVDAARAAASYFFDPGADPQIDSPDPTLWGNSKRHLVTTEAVVIPRKAGVKVYVAAMDVDDNSYTLWGATAPRRDFFDPLDRSPGLAGARSDNNDSTSVVVNGAGSRSGGVQAVNTVPQAAQAWLTVPTVIVNNQAVARFEFVSTLAPGDNFRVLASLAKDTLAPPAGGAEPKLVSKIPADYGGPAEYSEAAEREAKVVFRHAASTANQFGALDVPESSTAPAIVAADGKHTLASQMLTVRRRVNIEALDPNGAPPADFNFDLDPLQENRNGPITRYVTGIEGVGAAAAPFPHREIQVGPKTGAATGVSSSLQRKITMPVYDTLGAARPFPFVGNFPADFDHSWNYGAPRSAVVGRTPPTALGLPAGQFEGAYQNGRVALTPGVAVTTVDYSGLDHLYAAGTPAFEFQVFQNGQWQNNAAWRFNLMRPDPAGMELVFTAPLAAALPLGAPLRVGQGNTQNGIPGESTIAASTVNSVVVANAANGDSFRFPVLVYDDTSWDQRATAQLASAFAITAERTVTPGTHNLANSFVRDACIAFRLLSPPYRKPAWTFTKHVPVGMFIGPEGIWGYLLSLMADSQLLADFKLSQERCWTIVAFHAPDGFGGNTYHTAFGWYFGNYDPNAEHDPAGAAGLWPPGIAPGTLIPNGAFPPDANLSFFSHHDWIADDSATQAYMSGTYGAHNYTAALDRRDFFRCKVAVHEVMHQMHPNPLPVAGVGWSMYAGIVLPGDEHTIPGIMGYNDVADPVAAPTGLLQGQATFTAATLPPMISPYTARVFKERLKTLRKVAR